MNQVSSPDSNDDRTLASSTKLSLHDIGSIITLFLSSPAHRHITLAEFESMFLPAVELKQYRLFSAPSQPVGVAFWAFVTTEIAGNLMRGDTHLAPHQWRCGHELWLVDLIALHGDKEEMIDDLKVSLFPQTPLNFIEVIGERTIKRIA